MRKLLPVIKQSMLDQIERYPLKSAREIGKIVGCDPKTVLEYRKKLDIKYDEEFVKITAGKWIKYFGLAAKLYMQYIGELEEYKKETRTVVTKEGTEEVDLSPLEKTQIVVAQTNILTKLCEDAGNGEIRQVIRTMRNGNKSTDS